MIALGGIIGAGLFVGSSAVIDAGRSRRPCVSYLVAGMVVLMVMRMLGEMALARPGVGSFTEYARIGLGQLARASHRLAVLVLLGDRRRGRGGRGRGDHAAVDPGAGVGSASCS